MVAIDLTAVYDQENIPTLCNRLTKTSLPRGLVKWLSNYLRGRTFLKKRFPKKQKPHIQVQSRGHRGSRTEPSTFQQIQQWACFNKNQASTKSSSLHPTPAWMNEKFVSTDTYPSYAKNSNDSRWSHPAKKTTSTVFTTHTAECKNIPDIRKLWILKVVC